MLLSRDAAGRKGRFTTWYPLKPLGNPCPRPAWYELVWTGRKGNMALVVSILQCMNYRSRGDKY